MTLIEFKDIIRSTFEIGQTIIFKEFSSNLLDKFQENILIIKNGHESLNLSEDVIKEIVGIDTFSESVYTINDAEKLFYFMAAFRTHALNFLTKNTFEHKVKRYLFEMNFKLDYIQSSI